MLKMGIIVEHSKAFVMLASDVAINRADLYNCMTDITMDGHSRYKHGWFGLGFGNNSWSEKYWEFSC